MKLTKIKDGYINLNKIDLIVCSDIAPQDKYCYFVIDGKTYYTNKEGFQELIERLNNETKT